MWHEVTFGYLWITGSLRLPTAYRSLARPSSALEPSYSPNGVANHKTCRSSRNCGPPSPSVTKDISGCGLNTSPEGFVRTPQLYRTGHLPVS